jgi:hypothetical protein
MQGRKRGRADPTRFEPTRGEFAALIAELEKQVGTKRGSDAGVQRERRGVASLCNFDHFPCTLYTRRRRAALYVADELPAFLDQGKQKGTLSLQPR